MNFRLLAHLDVFAVIAQLQKNKTLFDSDGMLLLRDINGKEIPAFTQWKSLQRMLKTARARFGSVEDYGEIFIDCMKPGTATDWAVDVNPQVFEFVVPLVTNPFVHEHARNEAIHMSVGSLWAVNNAVHRSSANWGEHPRYHLVVQVKRAEKETEE